MLSNFGLHIPTQNLKDYRLHAYHDFIGNGQGHFTQGVLELGASDVD